jgi:predicted DNA-binding protein (UPF0251 family)
MFMEILFDGLPVLFVVSNLPALHAHRNDALQCRYLGDVFDNHERQRLIFVLHDVEGYEHNEIAEMLGCSVGNSKSQLHKARTKLRDVLRITRAENARKPKANHKEQAAVIVEPSSKAAATAA